VLGKKRPTCKRQTMNKGISFSLSLSKCERKVKEMKRRRSQMRGHKKRTSNGT
jgi:hypothetical protein